MPTKTQTFALGALALLSLGGIAVAQTPATDATPAASVAAGKVPSQTGQLKQFLINPRGDIDGLLLTDGTEVKVPPHLSAQLAATFKPGDALSVAGLRAASLPLVQAVAITNTTSGKTVTDEGPAKGERPRPPAPRPAADAAATPLQGRVVQLLHGPRGDVNGALLEDGTALRLPPHEASRLGELLAPGQSVAARGELVANDQGRTLAVQALGKTPDSLQPLEQPKPPRGPGKPGHGEQPPAPPAPGSEPPAPPAS